MIEAVFSTGPIEQTIIVLITLAIIVWVLYRLSR